MLAMDAICVFLTALSLSSLTAAQNVVSLTISPQPTTGTSGIVPPSFAGFGIEPSNLYSFTGGASENLLTKNLLQNLADYAGVPPHLRIGGNTQDYMIYDSSMDQYVVEDNPNAVGQGVYASDHMIIGPRFFEVINRFPARTPITFGLNLAYEESDYIEQITTMAEQAVERLTDVNLVSFEIGNEPDLYLQNQFRSNPQWGGSLYTQQWLDRANAVWDQVLRPRDIRSNFFEPGTTASTIGTSFQIDDLDQFGITQDANGSSNPLIAQWNQHDYYYYIGVSAHPLTQFAFLTLSTTSAQFAAWVTQIQQARGTGYAYALREMGVVGPIGLHEITDVFGAALWSLNFLLYAASLNLTMVGMHMTDNSNASAWQPTDAFYGNQPFVRPNYYAFAAFNQAIGPTCQAQVGGYVLQNQPEEYQGRSAAYSIYQDGTLASIVLINSNEANVSQSDKPSLTFELTLDQQFAGQDVYLGFLTNDGADAQRGTTFNGVSYEESGDGTPAVVDDQQQTVTVNSDGTVSIEVRDSQAVVANIGGPVGQRKANQEACASLSRSQPGSMTIAGAASSTSSSAATSIRTSTRTSATGGPTTTSGVTGISTMLMGTLSSAVLSLFVLLCM
jgi:Glycosyl hydrolase family 79 C-terminal beta domain